MIKHLSFVILLIAFSAAGQPIQLLDAKTQEPVSFATIAFGNGWGMHADLEGRFIYSEKELPGIDTLYISAIGYRDLKIPTPPEKTVYPMSVQTEILQEVLLTTLPNSKYKPYKIKSVSHAEYHDSWLQSVESEIAVLIEKPSGKTAHLTELHLPINVRENVTGKKITIRPFTTLMRVKFYENNNGKPGREHYYGNCVFTVSEKNLEEVYELNVSKYKILIPSDGLFVSVQVLGPADQQGNLIQTRTYNEIETKQGVVRVAISFRPLLPMTNTLADEKTFVRRVFLEDQQWYPFNLHTNPNSNLLRRGFNNYVLGAKMHLYNE